MPAYQKLQQALEDVYALKRRDGNSNAAEAVSAARNGIHVLWILFAASALCWVARLLTTQRAVGIGQISKSISHMDQVTQRNAASAEETASVGHELEFTRVVAG